MALKAAFIFLVPSGDPKIHSSTIKTEEVHLTTVGVENYEMACKIAEELAKKDIGIIELCGGFGNKGVALVSEAVKGKIPVGAVKFDIHPGLDNKSGDIIFC